MSETNLLTVEDTAAVPGRASLDTAGAMLRNAREKAGIHVAALAVAIKIPVKKLEALEADQLLGTHDLVFTRALASSVCRTLKIDPAPVLAALPQTVIRELHVDSNGLNAPFTPRFNGQQKSIGEFIAQRWVKLVLALCAGAVVIGMTGLWGQQEKRDSALIPVTPTPEESSTSPAMAPVVIPAPVATDAKPGDDVIVGSLAPAQSSAVPLDTNAASSLPVVPDGGATAKSTVVIPASAPAVSGAPISSFVSSAVASDFVMSFKARQQSVWIKVVDAKGEVRLSRNIAAGERVECGGVLPLSVIVGKADSVDVAVRGKPFDVSTFTRDNVARFEVK